MFLSIDRRMLCLLGVGTPQQVSGRTRVPEISAEKKALGFVVVEDREKGRIRISLRRPLAGPKLSGSGIRDHREIDRRDRSTKASVRHVTETASSILEGRDILVPIHKFAEQLIGPLPRALKRRRLTCQRRRR